MILQNTLGYAAMTMALVGALQLAGKATAPSPHIEVSALTYLVDGGVPFIVQERTVSGSGDILIANWQAEVYLIEGTKLRLICKGGDGADYPVGHLAHKMEFDYWVGEDGCFDKIPDGALVKLHAKHTWGEGAWREKWSERFRVDKTVFQ